MQENTHDQEIIGSIVQKYKKKNCNLF